MGRSLGHEVGAPVSGISALIKRAPEGFLPFPHVRIQQGSKRSAIQKGVSQSLTIPHACADSSLQNCEE